MHRLSLILSAAALVLAALATVLAYRAAELHSSPAALITAEAPAAETAAAPDAATIGPAVRDYLLENPEVLQEVIAALERKQADQEAAAQISAIEENGEAIFRSPLDGVINENGDITVVEFFDYNCGYCKRMLPELTAMLEADSGVRLVLKEWPVLGEDSVAAARVAIAVREVAPEAYPQFHQTLLAERGRVGRDQALAIAADLGVDRSALETAIADPDIDETIAQSYELANALGITGTPSYVIGDEVFMGAVGSARLKAKIDDVREGGCLTC